MSLNIKHIVILNTNKQIDDLTEYDTSTYNFF